MLKGDNLKRGMLVVAMKLSKKAEMRLPEGYVRSTQNQPIEVVHIEYPIVIFGYEGAAIKPTGGMFGFEKTGTQTKKYALDVRGIKFKEITPEYATALKEGIVVPLEEKSAVDNWDREP